MTVKFKRKRNPATSRKHVARVTSYLRNKKRRLKRIKDAEPPITL